MNNQQKNGATDPANLGELSVLEDEAKRSDAEAQYRVATIYADPSEKAQHGYTKKETA